MMQQPADGILEMLNMQDRTNTLVNPEWRKAHYAWHRAIYVEGAEMLDHLGTWKWWKKGLPDLVQAQIELVDIWHFGMSKLMDDDRLGQYSVAQLASHIYKEVQGAWEQAASLGKPETAEEVNAWIDRLVGIAAAGKFDLIAFGHILYFLDLDLAQLHRLYVGKNALNHFRQQNGYKTGSYQKIWRGEEDNVHLERILSRSPICVQSLYDWVYAELEAAYPKN